MAGELAEPVEVAEDSVVAGEAVESVEADEGLEGEWGASSCCSLARGDPSDGSEGNALDHGNPPLYGLGPDR